jgi:uncharacterized membrane protein (UPF0182 family)
LNKLTEVKEAAENYLRYNIELTKKIYELNYDEVKEFNEWYINHPHQQIISNSLLTLTHLKNKSFNLFITDTKIFY